MTVQTIVPNLWFDTKSEEAANFYVDVFSNRIGAAGRAKSEIITVLRYPQDVGNKKAGDVLTVEFHLEGQRFIAINGGPEFTFDEAVSFLVTYESQEEIDELVGQARGERRRARPVRVAEGSVRTELADRAECDGRTDHRPGREGQEASLRRDDAGEEDDVAELQRTYERK